MDSWGGAQWALVMWVVITDLTLPLMLRIAGVTAKGAARKSGGEWAGFYLCKLIGVATLFIVLWWGGFWS